MRFAKRSSTWLMALSLLLLATAAPSANAAEGAPAVSAALLAVGGEAATTPLHLGLADLAALPRSTVTATDHGTQGTWQGVSLIELLQRAGAPGGEALRGKSLALYVRVSAADGYRAVYSLAELDPLLGAAQVILADTHDGKPMDGKEGPLRIIAVGDKRPARWVRQVTAIDLLRAP